jgi:hydroxymethylpyrimidine/phosphomethylpyrimidine kinase
LLPLAAIITPNLPEAEVLLGREVRTLADQRRAARDLHALGPRAVVVKGGHGGGDQAIDVLFDGHELIDFEATRIQSQNTHGGGCTFSAAIAAHLARGLGLRHAVEMAKVFVTAAIRSSLAIGSGHGPVNPMYDVHGPRLRRPAD